MAGERRRRQLARWDADAFDPPPIEERKCDGRVPMGRKQAMAVAERERARGRKLDPVRCPFCRSWHVQRPPTMSDLEQIAARIRERSGNKPGETP